MSIRLDPERAATDYDLLPRAGVSSGDVVQLYGQDHRVLSVTSDPCAGGGLCSHQPGARQRITLQVLPLDGRPGEQTKPYSSPCCSSRDRGLYVLARRP